MIELKGKQLSHGTRPFQNGPHLLNHGTKRSLRHLSPHKKKTRRWKFGRSDRNPIYILTSQHLGIFRKQHLIKSWKKVNCLGFIGCNKTPWPPWPRRGRQLILPPHLAVRPHAQLECIQHVQPVIVDVHAVDGKNPAPVEVGSLSHHLQGFIHPRWLFGISSINSMASRRVPLVTIPPPL